MNKFIIKHLTIISLLAFFLVGCQSPQNNRAIDVSSKSMAADVKLGTQWGDGIESHVQDVNLYRINTNPLDTITIYYSAQTQNSGKSISEVMLNNGRVGMSILYDNDNKWPLIKQKNIINLQGKVGETYRLFYRNYSKDTYEIVATIDGLDVINGKAGSLSNNGYILRPNDTLIIEGFRKNNSEVAAFTFSNSNNAYVNYTDEGSPKNIGVIGTAIFQLNSDDAQHSENTPNAFPADKTDNSYAKPPRY